MVAADPPPAGGGGGGQLGAPRAIKSYLIHVYAGAGVLGDLCPQIKPSDLQKVFKGEGYGGFYEFRKSHEINPQ